MSLSNPPLPPPKLTTYLQSVVDMQKNISCSEIATDTILDPKTKEATQCCYSAKLQ